MHCQFYCRVQINTVFNTEVCDGTSQMSDRVQDTRLQCRFSVVSHHDIHEAEQDIHLLETTITSLSRQLSEEKKALKAEKKAHKATQFQLECALAEIAKLKEAFLDLSVTRGD